MIHSTHRPTGAPAVHVVPPHEGFLGSLCILAGAEPTRGMYFAFESETEPAAANTPLDIHAHSRYDESEYVLTGSRDIVVEEQRWDASSGFFALAPRHARHAMRTTRSFVLARRGIRRRHIASPGTRVLTIFSPGHMVAHEPSARF